MPTTLLSTEQDTTQMNADFDGNRIALASLPQLGMLE